MTATKSDLFRQTGPPLRIAGRGHRMVTRQVPASTILVDGQSMAGIEVPSKHLAAPAAFQADDIIAMNGSPDRDGGYPPFIEFGHRLPRLASA